MTMSICVNDCVQRLNVELLCDYLKVRKHRRYKRSSVSVSDNVFEWEQPGRWV